MKMSAIKLVVALAVIVLISMMSFSFAHKGDAEYTGMFSWSKKNKLSYWVTMLVLMLVTLASLRILF